MGPLPSPYERAIHSTYTCLEYFIVSIQVVYDHISFQLVHIRGRGYLNRLDYLAGVYFLTHAPTTYHHMHVMHLSNLQAEALAWVSATT